ncbi:ATP-binding protein [Sphingomonas sp. DG1-23]|uniref:AAA family ATPase n=1 Tax=Sphingomonas sp. DG1-23 TaxID=3068316 RepID=UPI00273E2365|nr:ATP-binding protein [Sphingomonas sp. DG1-23]MDP5279926.1 ATP-binding protein [Sphingomonas sp. DG1-23]
MQGFLGPTPQTDEDWQAKIYEALDLFSPGAPIDEAGLLAGRKSQIDKLLDAVLQRGQHAILYGERGVGKSSLANVFATKLFGPTRYIQIIHVNCHPQDDFDAIWRKVFRRLEAEDASITDRYERQIMPDDVVIEMSKFALVSTPIIILDEFDKIDDNNARVAVANTIKNLSDRSVKATIILVGVADSAERLVADHESVTRCLRHVPMHRMFSSELREIIETRLAQLGMAIQPDALALIVAMSRGLPHYAHLVGQQSARVALEKKKLVVDLSHIDEAMPGSVGQIDQIIRRQYHQATISPRKGNIYKEVLLAAALSPIDDLGYFAPADLQSPLAEILGVPETKVSLFGQHLKNLCEGDHGRILEQVGVARKYRYRFSEPMMQPFIVMNALAGGTISRERITALSVSHYEPRFSSEY